MDVPGLDGVRQAALAAAHQQHLPRAEPGARQQPREPRLLGRPGRRDAHARARQVLERAHELLLTLGDHERDRRRRREPQHEAGPLLRRARAEAQDRLERGRREIDLALGQRLRGARLGAGRLERHREAFLREVAFRLGHAQRKILG